MEIEAQAKARAEFDELVRDVRADLHAYCARMVGSAIDGEDIVQDALAKAYYRLSKLADVSDLRAWLFRVAHNRAIDYLRRHDVQFAEPLDPELPAPDEGEPGERAQLAAIGLSFFVKLTPMQRSSVILKDVLGYSMEEASEILDASVAAIKGALRRGRASLERLAGEDEEAAVPALTDEEERRLQAYAARFNARDFKALEEMLADEVRLDLVTAHYARGADAVGNYFRRYSQAAPVRVAPGLVEGRAVLLVSDPPEAAASYFMLIGWQDGRVTSIRDYRYARWVLGGGT